MTSYFDRREAYARKTHFLTDDGLLLVKEKPNEQHNFIHWTDGDLVFRSEAVLHLPVNENNELLEGKYIAERANCVRVENAVITDVTKLLPFMPSKVELEIKEIIVRSPLGTDEGDQWHSLMGYSQFLTEMHSLFHKIPSMCDDGRQSPIKNWSDKPDSLLSYLDEEPTPYEVPRQ